MDNAIDNCEDLGFTSYADQICMYMSRVYDMGMTTTSGGNISIKTESGNIWVSPSGIDKGALKDSDICEITPDGDILNDNKPSSEFLFHDAIYKKREDIFAVFHAHPIGLVTLSVLHQVSLVNLLPSIYRICKEVGFAPYALPGSSELASNIGDSFSRGYEAVILENHGIVIGGKSLPECYSIFETLEVSALIACRASVIGSINYISEKDFENNENLAMEYDHRKLIPMTEDEKLNRKNICTFSRRAYAQSFFTCSMGSISCRSGQGMLITPHGYDRYIVSPSNLVYVEGASRYGNLMPSFSAKFHQEIYDSNDQINSIIIAQPVNLMAFAVTDEKMNTATIPESFVFLRDLKVNSYDAINQNLKEVAKSFGEQNPIQIFKNNCVVSTGANLLQAFDRLEVAEFNAQVDINARAFGGVKGLNDKQQKELKDIYF